jgi:hypothetical protein
VDPKKLGEPAGTVLSPDFFPPRVLEARGSLNQESERTRMSTKLARCPYCPACDIILNDSLEVVFNPDTPEQVPCPHLIWATGGCSQWEPIVYGTPRIIGSTAIHWRHPDLSTDDCSEGLVGYMAILVQAGLGWEFAPDEPFQIQAISEEGMAEDLQGKKYTAWEADGWAMFAPQPREFLAALRACREKQSGVWKEAAGLPARVFLPADPDGANEEFFGNPRGRHALEREPVPNEDRWQDDGGQG